MKPELHEVPLIPEGVMLEWCSLCDHAILSCPDKECMWCSCNGAPTCPQCEPLDKLADALGRLELNFTRDEVEAQPGYIPPHERELTDDLRQAIELYGRRGPSGELNYDFYAWSGRVYRLREYRDHWRVEVYMGHLFWREIGAALAYQIMARGNPLKTVDEMEQALEKYDLERPRLRS